MPAASGVVGWCRCELDKAAAPDHRHQQNDTERSMRDGLSETWYLLDDMATCMVERPLRNCSSSTGIRRGSKYTDETPMARKYSSYK